MIKEKRLFNLNLKKNKKYFLVYLGIRVYEHQHQQCNGWLIEVVKDVFIDVVVVRRMASAPLLDNNRKQIGETLYPASTNGLATHRINNNNSPSLFKFIPTHFPLTNNYSLRLSLSHFFYIFFFIIHIVFDYKTVKSIHSVKFFFYFSVSCSTFFYLPHIFLHFPIILYFFFHQFCNQFDFSPAAFILL